MDDIKYLDPIIPIFIQDEELSSINNHHNISHWHDDIEIICVKKGNMNCQLGNDIFRLKTGDVCFINRKQMHHLYQNNKDDHSLHQVLIVNTNLLTQNQKIFDKYIKALIDDHHFSHVYFEGKSSYAQNIFDAVNKIAELMQEKKETYELEIVIEVHLIFLNLYKAYKNENVITHNIDANYLLQQKMIEYINDNYQEILTLDDIARAGNVSRSQCAKLFKKYTKQSPISYLNSYRLERSRDLLRNSSDSILDIALDCGFQDQSYYNRLFLREYGSTPLKYRKSLNN